MSPRRCGGFEKGTPVTGPCTRRSAHEAQDNGAHGKMLGVLPVSREYLRLNGWRLRRGELHCDLAKMFLNEP